MTSRRRIMSFALVLVLLVSLLPVFSAQADDEDALLGITIVSEVNVRVSSSSKAAYLFRLPANYVFTILSTARGDGLDWYRISVVSPENSRVYTGYIQAKYTRQLTADEAAAYRAGQATNSGANGQTPVNVPAVNTDAADGTIGIVSSSGVNFRKGPSTSEKVITQLNRGTVVSVLSIPSAIGEKYFYKVEYNGQVGYIMTTYLTVSSGSVPVVVNPTAAAPTDAVFGDYGWIKTTKGGVNLRATPGGTSLTMVKRNLTYQVLLPPVTKGSYTWYFVEHEGLRGYLRSDCVKKISDPTATATPTPTPTPNPADPTPTPTPTPNPADPTPTADPADPSALGYVKAHVNGGVNVRKSLPQNGKYGEMVGRLEKGTIVPFHSKRVVNKVTWYGVTTAWGATYVHGNYVIECDRNGNPVAEPAPTGGTDPVVTPAADNNQQEATYTTLKLGSTGNAVKNLTTELIRQNYLSGSATTKYTTTVENAVKKFQADKGLTVDGIAGPATQHKLYGTVPVGAADTSNPTFTIYPAEKIDWYTGGINELWSKGSNYKVYDVRTGIVWWAHRWSGGSHVDAEPLTAADTARLAKSYGVTTAQEIEDKDLYQRRPLLVTIGTRTFCCSLYGVPHNYPKGDTIADNDFRGQVCIHFTNSKTHDSNRVDSAHQAAIEEAYQAFKNGVPANN